MVAFSCHGMPRSNSVVATRSIGPMRRRQPKLKRVRGFSLIELVAAFLIFAIAIGVQMQVLTTSMQTTRSSGGYTMAALNAQSILDTVGIGERIHPGTSNGEFADGSRWEMLIDRIDPAAIEPPVPVGGGAMAGLSADQQMMMAQQVGNSGAMEVAPVEIYQVDLTVHWGKGERSNASTFSTLRAVNPDPEAMGQGGLNMRRDRDVERSGRE